MFCQTNRFYGSFCKLYRRYFLLLYLNPYRSNYLILICTICFAGTGNCCFHSIRRWPLNRYSSSCIYYKIIRSLTFYRLSLCVIYTFYIPSHILIGCCCRYKSWLYCHRSCCICSLRYSIHLSVKDNLFRSLLYRNREIRFYITAVHNIDCYNSFTAFMCCYGSICIYGSNLCIRGYISYWNL